MVDGAIVEAIDMERLISPTVVDEAMLTVRVCVAGDFFALPLNIHFRAIPAALTMKSFDLG